MNGRTFGWRPFLFFGNLVVGEFFFLDNFLCAGVV